MSLEDPIGIIELGDANLKCLIFKVDKNNSSKILSSTLTPSDGIKNNVVINLSKATTAIRNAISSAEKKANISLKKINVVLEQPDFLCTKFSKHKKIDGSQIYRSDIEFLLKEAKKQLVLNDKNQSIIHIFNHSYIVDGKIFIDEPINVFANSLSHEMTFVTTSKNNVKNINQVFNDCDIEIERLMSQTFSLGVKLLSRKELQNGSILINLESKKASIGLFKNLALLHSATIPIGIDHISKDISKVFSLNSEESDFLKKNINFLFESDNLFDENNYLKKEYFIQSKYRKISKDLFFKVVKSRLDEIFELLKKHLIVPDFILNSGINFLLTGSGSQLKNMDMYCKDFFTFSIDAEKQNKKNNDLDFEACLGALKIIKDGWETEAIAEIKEKNIEKISFFAKIFGIRN